MTAEQYRAVIGWFNRRPAAKRALWAAGKGAVAAVYALYLGMLAWMALGGRWNRLLPLAAAPAAAFLLGTGLRAAIDRPRPYTALGFVPLFPKAAVGRSMPSRHCFSAAAIAVSAAYCSPAAGAVLAVLAVCIAVNRVLVGHHYVSDVAAGLAFGALCAAGVLALWQRCAGQAWTLFPFAG